MRNFIAATLGILILGPSTDAQGPAPSMDRSTLAPRVETPSRSSAPLRFVQPVPGEMDAPAVPLHEGTGPLAPGIFVSSPYSGIVVVPEAMDPGLLKKPPQSRNVMPAPEPELRLTPKSK